MKALIKKLYENDVVRYIFFGGCTTLVNLVSFFSFQKTGNSFKSGKYSLYYSGNFVCLCSKFKICFSG